MRRPRVMLLGRLLSDPELHCTPSGERVVTFEVTTASYGPLDEAERCHRCVAWNQGARHLADLVVDHLRAGDLVYVEGRLQQPPRPRLAGDRIARAVVLASDVQLHVMASSR